MATILEMLDAEQRKASVPEFRVGDTVRVHQMITEGNKDRIQIFEGVVIRKSGSGSTATFTVRKVSYNVGVERIFPIHSPRVQKVELKQQGRVRRARLYYLRGLSGKAAKIKQAKRLQPLAEAIFSEQPAEEAAAE